MYEFCGLYWIFQIVYDTLAFLCYITSSKLLSNYKTRAFGHSFHSRHKSRETVKITTSLSFFFSASNNNNVSSFMHIWFGPKKNVCMCVIKCISQQSMFFSDEKLTGQKKTHKKLDTKMSTVIACFIRTHTVAELHKKCFRIGFYFPICILVFFLFQKPLLQQHSLIGDDDDEGTWNDIRKRRATRM